MSSPSEHVPVMLDEVLEQLAPQPGQVLIDGTLGGAGHTRALAERVGPTGLVISLDRDPAAVIAVKPTLTELPVRLFIANYCDIPEVLSQLEIEKVDGVLLDLGLSSDQLADRERGFSFDADGPLDLRFNPEEGQPASEMVNRMRAEPLADLIYEYGEERFSRRIARRIVEEREKRPIETAKQLAEIVRRAVPRSPETRRLDPATRTFQALRIAVNNELKSLELVLTRLPDCVRSGGRIAIISFHSLEDRRVKEAFRNDDRYQVITKKPLRPQERETFANPRARSAKLRVAART